MFGYIRAAKPELRVKEYELYKSVYCSLCRTLGRQYGFYTRFVLSYDFTFLALLELSLSDGFAGTVRSRCVCNPLKKCNYCKSEDSFSLSAAAVVVLLYYKLCDDVDDEKGIKRLFCRVARGIYRHDMKKAALRYPALSSAADTYFSDQKKAEQMPECGLDRAAEPTSVMLSSVFSLCGKNEIEKRVLSSLGRLMGRYIYLMDCVCDVEKDAKSGSFNPYRTLSRAEAAKEAQPQLYIIIHEAIRTFELLPCRRFKDVLGNIIYVGLEDTMKKELFE